MNQTCIYCSKIFISTSIRKTCSKECMNLLKSKLTTGRKKSEEHKKKISNAHTGKKRAPFSQEWRDNLSKARKGKKFTKEHCKNISLAQKESKGSNWQGGKTKARKEMSFKWIKRTGRWIRLHRYIMEQHIGRPLLSCEIVHHRNEIANDDRLENLRLFANQSEHAKFHSKKSL